LSEVLRALSGRLRAEGGLLAEALAPETTFAADPARHGALASGGPRAAADPAAYAVLVEAIREGYLLHYAEGRVVRPDDPDLALLAGDRLYALGLADLAALGDLAAVRELADVIALSAHAHAADAPELADAAWEAGVTAVGHGGSEALEAAKEAARRLDPEAPALLRASARQEGSEGRHDPDRIAGEGAKQRTIPPR
jgi:hypothetical protein